MIEKVICLWGGGWFVNWWTKKVTMAEAVAKPAATSFKRGSVGGMMVQYKVEECRGQVGALMVTTNC